MEDLEILWTMSFWWYDKYGLSFPTCKDKNTRNKSTKARYFQESKIIETHFIMTKKTKSSKKQKRKKEISL